MHSPSERGPDILHLVASKPPLKRMFDSVPRRYDFLNRLLTLTLDQRWRRRAAKWCLESNPLRVLDLCCGTGDLAFQLAVMAKGSIEIVGLDFSLAMLQAARKKADRSDYPQSVSFVEGDSSAMDFPDDHFDSVAIAFAFRNITWRNPLGAQTLAEIRRVLRVGGTLVIVETSQPTNRVLRALFHTYLSAAVAPIGGLISGHKAAYRYLRKSARDFYDHQGVSSMLTEAGFDNIQVEMLAGGITAIHVASKPKKL